MTRHEGLKVLMVIPTFDQTGGAQDQLRLLAAHFWRDKVSCDIFAPGENLFGKRVSVDRSRPIVNLAYNIVSIGWSFLYAICKCWQYNVIHVHGLGSAFFIFTIAAKLLSRPIIVKVPRSGPGSYLQSAKKSPLRSFLIKNLGRWVRAFVVLTPDARDELREFGICGDQVVEIPNGVELPTEHFSKSTSPLKVCFAGRLIARKNVSQILEAIAKARRDLGLVIQFTIIGDGPELVKLRELSKKLFLTDCTTFTGDIAQESVFAHFKQSHIFVLSSQSEGMSNSLLQACAFGCVPIVSDIPQNRAVVGHGKTGLLFKTTSELASSLARMSYDEERLAIAAECRRWVEAHYSVRSICGRYRELYDQVGMTIRI